MDNTILKEIKEITDLGYKEETAIEILKLEALLQIKDKLSSMDMELSSLRGNLEAIENVMSDITCYVPSRIEGTKGKYFLRITGDIHTT